MSTLPAYRQPVVPFGKSPGRPTKLTPDLQERICGYIANGAYTIVACRAAGVNDESVSEWKQRGATGEEPYAGFLAAWQRAEAIRECKTAAKIVEIGDNGNWIAGMTFLERRHPERWARQDRLQIEQRSVQELTITVQFALPPGLEHSPGQVVSVPPAIEGEVRELGPGGSGTDTPAG